MLLRYVISITQWRILLAIFWSVNLEIGAQIVTENTTSINVTTQATSTTEKPRNGGYDYVVRFSFVLDERKVPAYLIDLIYDNQREISTNDIINLFKIQELNLKNASDILYMMSAEELLTIDGFGTILYDLDIDFKNFYDDILIKKFNVTGEPLRNFLKALSINEVDFMYSIAFGTPELFSVFRKGNFSEESLRLALVSIEKTPEDLFNACLEEFVMKLQTLDLNNVINILKKYDFNKEEALDLWSEIGINMKDVYSVDSLNRLLLNVSNSLEEESLLGVLYNLSFVAVNKAVEQRLYELQNFTYISLLTLDSNITLYILDSFESRIIDITFISFITDKEDLTQPQFGEKEGLLENCQLICWANSTWKIHNVSAVSYDEYIKISANSNSSDFSLGSPLICEDQVYGLVNQSDSDGFMANKFHVIPSRTESSSAFHMVNYLIVSITSFLCTLLY